MIKFSVIIPTYNSIEYLKKSISSVLAQTYNDFEIIVVNDGSTDETGKYLLDLQNNKVRVFSSVKNLGPASARNTGLKNARGAWVCFLDADDEWLSCKLEHCEKIILKNNNFEVMCHNHIEKNIYNKNSLLVKNGPYKKDFYKNLIMYGNRLSTSCVIVKMDFVKKNKIFFENNKKYYSVEDFHFWLCLSLNEARFYFLNKSLSFYNVHDSNISQMKYLHLKNNIRLLYHHVYKIQTFQKNKKKLWKFVFNRYKMQILLTLPLKIKISGIYNFFFRNPTLFLKIFSHLLLNYLCKKI